MSIKVDMPLWVGDPSRGLEYNELQTNRKISPGTYLLDIARSPYMERSYFHRKNVQDEVGRANGEGYRLNDRERKVKGKTI